MSSKGGQSLHKHGGAHTSTHGTAVLINGSVIPAEIDGRSAIIGIQNIGEEVNVIQDGGQLASLAKGDHVFGEVLAASGPAGCGEADQVAALDLGGVETAVTLSGHTITNTDWLKTKLGNLGGVFLIQNGVVATENGEGAYELREVKEVGGFELGTDVSSVGNLQPQVCVDEVPGTSTQGVRSILVSQNPAVANVNNVKPLQGSVVSIANLYHGGQHQSDSTCRLGDKEGNEGYVLRESYRACLEEMEKGSHMTLEDKPVNNNSEEDEFQSMEFQSLNNDKSNTLMTPQELELMPERGKEFEESVGPKEDLRPDTPLDTAVISDNQNEDLSLKMVNQETNSFVMTNSAAHSISTPSGQEDIISYSSHSSVSNCSVPVQSQQGLILQGEQDTQTAETNAGGANGVATISIATDNSSNSTQILINTPQGQQIFQINTADINKATSALQPLALQGGLVGKDVNGKIVNAGTVNGITVEDGYLVIPVNGNEMDGNPIENQDLSLTEGEMSDDSQEDDAVASNPGRIWMCPHEGCQKTFSKLSKLKIHLMRHTGERPFKCSMADCDWAFTTAYKLKRHEESHQKKKDYECGFPGCGRKFTTIYNLNTHRKLHERPCTEECPDCGLRFPTMRKLDLHMKNHIGAQKNYKCPIEGCNKMFFSPHCMGSHTRVHQEDRDLTCHFEGCGKVYDKLCRLKQHMRTHTGEKPYVCNVESCGWAFSTASKLKRHQRKHTGERKWVCPVEDCSKAFMRAEHLKGHLVTHSGERPFICQFQGCGARFTAKSSMYVHIKKHNEADKKVLYFCPLDGCDKKFNNKTGLRTHIAKHYQNALAQANTGDLSSLIPILSPEDIQEGLEGLMAAQTDLATETAAQDAIVASVNSILPPDAVSVDQADLIVSDDGTLTSAALTTPVSELCGQVPGSLVSQLVVTADRLEEGLAGVSDAGLVSPPPPSTPDEARLAPDHHSPGSTTTLFTTDLDPASLLQSEKTSGSARTDYCSNHMLMDRAKKRRKLMKNSLDGGDSNSSSIDLNNFQDLNEDKVDLGGASLVSTSAVEAFPGGDLVSSAAITFRDPETGAIYVQTQLLQDDPPNPELYTDDTGLDDTGQSVLTTDLPVTLFQDTHPDDVTEFTSTTINLQDLA